jgi:DNA-directed RNA polymerase specialized sigma24 family protein
LASAARIARAFKLAAPRAARTVLRNLCDDAAYLELAERVNLPLASLDGDLRRAANRLGLPLLGTSG